MAQIFEVREGTKAVVLVNGRLSVGGTTPVKLHGGALLGVSLNSVVKSGARCKTLLPTHRRTCPPHYPALATILTLTGTPSPSLSPRSSTTLPQVLTLAWMLQKRTKTLPMNRNVTHLCL